MPCQTVAAPVATNKALRYRQRAAHVVELRVVEGAVAEPEGYLTADDSLALAGLRDLPPRSVPRVASLLPTWPDRPG